MDLDTILAVGALVVACNVPFYALALTTWRTLARLQAVCPLCRGRDQALNPAGGELNGN